MNHHPKGSVWTLLPPPLVFIGAFLIGMFLQRLAWPRADSSPTLLVGLGVTLAVLGLAFALSAIGMFIANRTTVIPHGQPSRFVARGPYRWTRNPMYLGLALAYIGVAIWIGAWLAIPFLALPLIHLSRWIIPMEEAGLRALFGEQYEDYRRRVGRWI